MIDLKEIITKYPECLESAAKLKSFLADLYPEEKARCSILATIFDVGIAEQIKNGKVDKLSVDSYCNSLEDSYGYSPRLIRECVEIWSIAYKPALEILNNNGLHQSSIEELTKDFKVKDGVLIEYLGADECVVIPKGITKIGKNAFWGSDITAVTIPDGVISIEERAFGGCFSLESISLPKSLKAIYDNAFTSCSISSIEIPNGVEWIDDGAFSGCNKLNEISMPDSVFYIGRAAFSNTMWNRQYFGSDCGAVYLGKVLYCYYVSCHDDGPEYIEVKEGTLGISAGAFSNCKSLSKIRLPDSLKYIGPFIFPQDSYPLNNHIEENITVACNKDSFGEKYAQENKMIIEYID